MCCAEFDIKYTSYCKNLNGVLIKPQKQNTDSIAVNLVFYGNYIPFIVFANPVVIKHQCSLKEPSQYSIRFWLEIYLLETPHFLMAHKKKRKTSVFGESLWLKVCVTKQKAQCLKLFAEMLLVL